MGGWEQTFPGGSRGLDTLRLILFAYEIRSQNLSANDPNHFELGPMVYWWNFIAPTDIQENVTHNYEEYSSWQGRGAQLKSDIIQSIQSTSQGAGGDISRKGGSTKPALNKVDSPMVWVGSERKEYSFTIPLAWYSSASPKDDVITPIHNLRVFSSASLDGNIDTVKAPHVFEVFTSPSDFIRIDHAALTNVQVTYNAPYVAGYPQRAELTITFRDLKPLYGNLWTNGGRDKTTVEMV